VPKGNLIDFDELLVPPYTTVKQMMTDLYLTQKLGLETLAEKFGVNKSVIKRILLSHNIPIRGKGRPTFDGNVKIANPKKQKKSKKPKGIADANYKNHMRQCQGLGIWRDDIITRRHDMEDKDCDSYEQCLTICAVYDGNYIPCPDCIGTPPWSPSWMDKVISDFQERAKPEGLTHGPNQPGSVISANKVEELLTLKWRRWLEDKDSSEIYIGKIRYFPVERTEGWGGRKW